MQSSKYRLHVQEGRNENKQILYEQKYENGG